MSLLHPIILLINSESVKTRRKILIFVTESYRYFRITLQLFDCIVQVWHIPGFFTYRCFPIIHFIHPNYPKIIYKKVGTDLLFNNCQTCRCNRCIIFQFNNKSGAKQSKINQNLIFITLYYVIITIQHNSVALHSFCMGGRREDQKTKYSLYTSMKFYSKNNKTTNN